MFAVHYLTRATTKLSLGGSSVRYVVKSIKRPQAHHKVQQYLNRAMQRGKDESGSTMMPTSRYEDHVTPHRQREQVQYSRLKTSEADDQSERNKESLLNTDNHRNKSTFTFVQRNNGSSPEGSKNKEEKQLDRTIREASQTWYHDYAEPMLVMNIHALSREKQNASTTCADLIMKIQSLEIVVTQWRVVLILAYHNIPGSRVP